VLMMRFPFWDQQRADSTPTSENARARPASAKRAAKRMFGFELLVAGAAGPALAGDDRAPRPSMVNLLGVGSCDLLTLFCVRKTVCGSLGCHRVGGPKQISESSEPSGKQLFYVFY